MRDYDEWEDAYWGRYTIRRETGSWGTRLLEFFRRKENEEEVAYYRKNIVRPIVEQKRAVLAVPPSAMGIPPEISDDGYAVADYLELVLRALFDCINIRRRFGDQGWFLSVQGSAVLVQEWDKKKWRPKITVRSPRNFYAIPKDPDFGTVSEGMFVEWYPGLMADRIWPGHGLDKYDKVEVIDYRNEQGIGVWADNGRICLQPFDEHGLDFCPLVVASNIAIPNTMFGDSDVMGLKDQQDELNERDAMEKRWVKKTMDAAMVIKDPINAPREVPEDGNAVITVGEHGDVGWATPPKLDYDWWKSKQELRDLINATSDTPALLSGDAGGNYNSARAMAEAKSPFMGRIQLRNQYILPAWTSALQQVIAMMDHFSKSKPVVLRGSEKGTGKNAPTTRRWSFTYEPEKLGGWAEFELSNDSADYLDEQTKFVMLVQAVQNGFTSKKTARQYTVFNTDPAREDQLIKDEMLENVRMTALATQMANSPMTQNPDMNEPGYTNYALGNGRMGETPAPQGPPGVQMDGMVPPAGPGGPTAQSVAPEAAGAQGDMLEMLVSYIAGIENTRGRIWIALVGGLADNTLDEGDKVEMYFEKGVDKATVFNAIAKDIPDLHGRINPNPGKPPEGMPAIECTGADEETMAAQDEADAEQFAADQIEKGAPLAPA